MCYTILESPEQAKNTQNRRFLIFVPQLEFSMFQTFDFPSVDILDGLKSLSDLVFLTGSKSVLTFAIAPSTSEIK